MSRGARFGLVYGALILLIMSIPMLARSTGLPWSYFVRDTFAIGRIPVYAGLLSNIGTFLWWGASAIALFAGSRLRTQAGSLRRGRFLTTMGLLTAVLALDDFFMFHEWVVPHVLGISETWVLGAYVVLVAGMLVVFRDVIRREMPVLLFAAFALFGLSELMDLAEHSPAPGWFYLTEEGLKLVGIGTWCLYYALVSARALRPALEGGPPDGGVEQT